MATSNPSSPPPDDKGLAEAIKALKQCVNSLPPDHIQSIARSYEGYESPGTVTLYHRASESLSQLQFEAEIGNGEAIEALAKLGVEIAVALAAIVDVSEDELETKKPRHYARPSQCEQQRLDESIRSAVARLESFPPSYLTEALKVLSRDPAFHIEIGPEHLVHTGIVLERNNTPYTDGVDDALLVRSLPLAATDAEVELALDSIPDSQLVHHEIAQMRSSRESSTPATSTDQLISGILSKLLGQRLRLDAKRAARDIAMQAAAWPFAIPAIVDKRDALLTRYPKALGLGMNDPILAKRGQRDFRGTVYTGATWAIFTILEQERRAFTSYNDEHRANILAEVQRLEGTPHSLADGSDGWTRWVLLASVLPPLQNSKPILDRWLDAAISFLYSKHQGDLDKCDFPGVLAPQHNVSGSTRETLIRNQLRLGFQGLAPGD